MTFPILGGNGAVAGYSIDNSLRFNDDDSARLTNTAGTPTSTSTGTFSFWIKKTVNNNAGQKIYSTLISATPSQSFQISFSGANADGLQMDMGNDVILETSALYRDNSAFYHFIIAIDQSQGTASNKIKVYVNGVQQTSFAVDNRSTYGSTSDLGLSINGQKRVIGSHMNETQNFLDGYLTEFYFIDGQQLSPTDFGEFDEDSGIWKPIEYTGSYGTNGFYLDFENSGSLGADQSGNGNNFTPTNLASTDQTTDTPTNNFATGNPLARSRFSNQGTISEGNLKYNALADERGWLFSSQGISQGKWYWEVKITAIGRFMVGVGYESVLAFGGTFFGNNPSKAFSILDFNGNLYYDGTNTSYGSSLSVNDIVMVALDMDNHLCWFGKNGTWFDSATQSEIENSTATNDATTQMGTQQNLNSGEPVFPFMTCQENGQTGGGIFNFGNPSFSISSGNSDGNGYGNFEYSVPSGYLALCTQNLATELSPTIDDGSQYFNTVLYSGDGTSDQDITGVGFQPDWVWLKARSSAYNHRLYDSTRGALKNLQSNSNTTEATATNGLISFDTDGFSVSQGGDEYNASGQNYVGWSWKANGGTTSSNTDGSITSTVQVNSTAGFSIATYSGTGSAGTVGHGLGVAPKFVMPKCRNVAQGWASWHTGLSGSGYILELNERNAEYNNGTGSYTALPTSSVVNLGTDHSVSGRDYVMYCFADVEGYSKFGKYTGNGSSDGTFIYTGFRPALIITKQINSTEHWMIRDTKINSFNVANKIFYPNLTNAESTTSGTFDILSNGFKARGSDPSVNGSGSTYIYLTFAENPFVSSSGVPVVAR